MLQLEQVHKSYRQGRQRVDALRGVDLRIDRPGFFAIMGPSGSGKSTLLHLAAGLDQADQGRVVVNDQDLGALSESQLTEFRRRQVGMVFQKFNLIATLTAAQNVALPGRLDHRPRKWIEQRVGELLADLGLADRAGHRPDAMSGGEQQRVAIARAMLFSPPLLLADEPTGNLDSASSDRLWTLLGDVAEKHKMSVVMVTHEAAAAAHCQKVFVLGDGRCRGEFDVNGLDHGGVASRYQQLSAWRGRSLLLVIAVALATVLSVAVSAIVGTVGASFRMSLGRMSGFTDLEARHSYGAYLDQSLLDQIRAWPEVALAAGRVEAGAKIIDHRNGKNFTGLALGVDPDAEAELHPQDFSEGRWLAGSGEIVLDPNLAKGLDAKVGDTIEARSGISADLMGSIADMMLGHKTAPPPVPTTQATGVLKLRVVGLVRRPHLPILQRPTGYVTLPEAQQLLGITGKVESIQIELKPGADADKVAAKYRNQLPPGVELHVEAAAASGVQHAIRSTRLVLLLIMVPVFLSAGFIIVTSLTTAVTERSRELGILRCIGASRGQIGGAQLLSGAILAGLGALVALPVGLALAYLFYRREMHQFATGFQPDWVAVCVALGAAVATGLLAGVYPALRAAWVRPVEALAARARLPSARGLFLCLLFGVACILVEPAALCTPLDAQGSFWFYLFAGAPALFTGFILLSVPALVVLSRIIAPLLSAALRLPKGLLRQNIAATPYRHGLTGAAMMVGLAMLVVVWTNGRSVLADWYGHMRMPDGFVHSFFAMSDAEWHNLQHIPGVAAVCPTTMFAVQAQGIGFGVEKLHPMRTLLVSLDPRTFFDMVDLTWLQGDPATALAKMEAGRAMLVSREYMVAHGVGVGSQVTLDTPSDGPVPFEVAGVVSSPGLEVAVQFFGIHRYYAEAAVASIFVSRTDTIRYFGNDNINLVLLKFTPGFKDEDVVKAIRDRVPGVIVGSSSMIRSAVHAALEGFMHVASTLAALTLLIACFGVGNLVLANLAARRFEYGVLRALGAQRWLLIRLVAAESLLVALTGCLAGTGLGLEISLIARQLHERLLGLTYSIHIPWDVIASGWAIVAALALAASLPGLWRLLRAHPREMLVEE